MYISLGLILIIKCYISLWIFGSFIRYQSHSLGPIGTLADHGDEHRRNEPFVKEFLKLIHKFLHFGRVKLVRCSSNGSSTLYIVNSKFIFVH